MAVVLPEAAREALEEDAAAVRPAVASRDVVEVLPVADVEALVA